MWRYLVRQDQNGLKDRDEKCISKFKADAQVVYDEFDSLSLETGRINLAMKVAHSVSFTKEMHLRKGKFMTWISSSVDCQLRNCRQRSTGVLFLQSSCCHRGRLLAVKKSIITLF